MGSETVISVSIIVGATLIAFTIALIVLAFLVLKIARLYAPEVAVPRRTPAFGKRVSEKAEMFGGTPIKGVNGYPQPQDSVEEEGDGDRPDVAEQPVITEVTAAAEGTIAQDREHWWEQMRDDGYTDEEIQDIENSNVVPVFEEA